MPLTGIEQESVERLLKTVASGVFVYRRPSERERRQMRDVRSGTLARDALRELMDDRTADIMLRLAAGKALVRRCSNNPAWRRRSGRSRPSKSHAKRVNRPAPSASCWTDRRASSASKTCRPT